MKKKLMVLLASAMVLASLAGCGNNNAEEASGASSEAEETAGAADPAMESTDGTAGEEEVEKPGEEKPYLCYRVQFFALPKEDAEMTLPEESAAEEDAPT